MVKGKRGQTWETLIPWLIAITILVIIGLFAYFMKDELISLAGKIARIFRS